MNTFRQSLYITFLLRLMNLLHMIELLWQSHSSLIQFLKICHDIVLFERKDRRIPWYIARHSVKIALFLRNRQLRTTFVGS